MGRPTINDVATAAGVSKGAVSFALNGRPGISPQTRARILEAAESLGWAPSPRARALSVSKALAVGLVIARPPEILRADAFFPSFIAGLETVLSTRGTRCCSRSSSVTTWRPTTGWCRRRVSTACSSPTSRSTTNDPHCSRSSSSRR